MANLSNFQLSPNVDTSVTLNLQDDMELSSEAGTKFAVAADVAPEPKTRFQLSPNVSTSMAANFEAEDTPSTDDERGVGTKVWENIKEGNRLITDEEIKEIAARYKTDEDDVRGIVRLYRGKVTDKGMYDTVTGLMDKIGGYAGSALVDLPQWGMKKMQGTLAGIIGDEGDALERERLWDEVRDLTREKRTYLGEAVEFGVGLVPITRGIKLATTVAGASSKVAEAAAGAILKSPLPGVVAKPLAGMARMTPLAVMGSVVGAGAGLASSDAGEELEGMRSGAIFGAILSYGIPMGVIGTVKGVSTVGRGLNYLTGGKLNVFQRKQLGKITEEVTAELTTHSKREEMLFEAGYNGNTKLENFSDKELIQVAKELGVGSRKSVITKIVQRNPGMTREEASMLVKWASMDTPQYRAARKVQENIKRSVMATPAYQAAHQAATKLRDSVRNTPAYKTAKKAAQFARKTFGKESPEYTNAYTTFQKIRNDIVESPAYKKVDKKARNIIKEALRTDEYVESIKKVNKAKELGRMRFQDYRDAVAEEIAVKAQNEFVEFGDKFLPHYTQMEKKPEAYIDILESLTDERAIKSWVRALNLPKAVMKELTPLIKEGMTKEATEKLVNRIKSLEVMELQSHPTMEALRTFVDKVAKTEGSPEAMQSLWNKYRFGKLANKSIIDPLKEKSGLGTRIFRFLSATQHVLHDLDRIFGSDVGLHGIRLNTKIQLAENLYLQLAPDTVKALDSLSRAHFGRYPTKELQQNLVKYIERPESWVKKNGPAPKGFEDYRLLHTKVMKEFVEIAEKHGIKIDELKRIGYVHMAVKSPRDVGNILREELYKLASRGINLMEDRLTPKKFKALMKSDKEVKEVVNSIKYLTGGSVINSTDELVRQYSKLIDNTYRSEMIGRVNSFGYDRAMEQTIPWLIREVDTVQLADKWLKNSLKTALTREPLREIGKWISIFRNKGREPEAAYLETYLRKATGTERVWLFKLEAFDDMVDSYVKSPVIRDSIKAIPAAASLAMTAMYASLLTGPRSFFQNLEQPITKMAGGIGETIGLDIAMRSYIRTASLYSAIPEHKINKLLNKHKGFPKDELTDVIQDAVNKGQIPAAQFGEAISNSRLDRAQVVVNGMSRVFLHLFDKGDRVTRVVGLFAGQELAERIMKKDAGVMKEFVDGQLKRAPAVRNEILRLASAGKTLELRDLISEYLIQNEMFAYNAASKSEFAYKVGPYLSMFSKWPTEVLGDVIGGIRAGEVDRTLTRVLTPLAQMWAIGMVLKEKYKDLDRETRKTFDLVVGKPEYFAGRAPVAAIPDLFASMAGLGTKSPMISSVANLFMAAKGDEKARRDLVHKDMYNWLGVGMYKHWAENWPRVFLGAYNLLPGKTDIDTDILPDVKRQYTRGMSRTLRFRELSRAKRNVKRGIRDVFDWIEELDD